MKPSRKGRDFSYFFLLLLLLLVLQLLLFKRQLPDGKTPWQWRTEKYQNCAQKLPNVTSETHRKGCDFSYFSSSCCCCSCSCNSFYSKRQLPDGKTPWQWRTEKYQNCAQKLPNVTSETHRKGCDFSYFFLLLLLLLLLLLFKKQLPDGKTPWQWRTEKYQNCAQKLPNVTSETHRKGCDFSYFFLLLLLLLALATPSIQKTAPGWENTMAVKDGKVSKLRPKIPNVTSETHRKGCDFSYFFLLLLLLLLLLFFLFSFYSKSSSRMGKHHGSEGRKSIKIAPKNSLM